MIELFINLVVCMLLVSSPCANTKSSALISDTLFISLDHNYVTILDSM